MGKEDELKLSQELHSEKVPFKDKYDEFIENLNQTKMVLSILNQNLEKLKTLENDIKNAITSSQDQGF